MSSVLFYIIPIGFCIGIFLRSVFSLPDETIIFLLVLSFALGVLWRRGSYGFSSPLLLGSVLLLTIACGLLRFDVASWNEPALARFVGAEVALEGVVVREPDIRTSAQHLYIEEKSSGELFLVTVDAFMPISYGDRVVVEGILEIPEAFETDLGRTFNYQGYLKARRVEYAMFFANVSIVNEGEGNVILATLIALKRKFMDVLEQMIPEPQAGLAEGLLLGVKRAMGSDLEGAFRATGIIHIVVLSGYNIMLVAEAMIRVLSFFFRPMLRMVFGIAAIALFALMVGLSATVVRASLMAALVLYARATGRTGDALRALCLAGVGMLLINPHLLVYDPGFQLSFLATLGLILVSPKLEHFLGFAPTTLQIREFLTATIATQIMVLPLLLYLIGEFSVVAVLVNVLVLPMVPLAMLLAFVTGIAGFIFAPLALLVGFVANLSLSYIIVTATLFAALPFASFAVPAFPFWVVLVLYGALALVLILMSKRTEDKVEEVTGDDELAEWKLVPFETVSIQTNRASISEEIDARFPFR